MDEHYDVFVAEERLIPATAELTGKPEKDIRKIWDRSQKQGKPCIFRVAGELPRTKRCAVCNTLVRSNALDCKTCGDIFCN